MLVQAVRILLLAWLGWCCISGSGPPLVSAAAQQPGAPLLLQRAQDAVANARELEGPAWPQQQPQRRPFRRRRHQQQQQQPQQPVQQEQQHRREEAGGEKKNESAGEQQQSVLADREMSNLSGLLLERGECGVPGERLAEQDVKIAAGADVPAGAWQHRTVELQLHQGDQGGEAAVAAAASSYQQDFKPAVIENSIQFATSAGVLHMPLMAHLPGHLLPLCLEAPPYSYYEKVMLFFFLLVTAMLVFIYFRVPVQLGSHSRLQASGGGIKAALQRKSGRTALVFSAALKQQQQQQQPDVPQLGSRTSSCRGVFAVFASFAKCVLASRWLRAAVEAMASAFASPFNFQDEARQGHLPPPSKTAAVAGVAGKSRDDTGTPSAGSKKSSDKKPALAPILVRQPQAKLSKQGSRSDLNSCSSPGNRSFRGSSSNLQQESVQSPVLAAAAAAVAKHSSRDSPRKSPQVKTPVVVPKIQPPSPMAQVESLPAEKVVDKVDRDKARKKKKRTTGLDLVKQEASSGRTGSGSSSPSSSPASPGRPVSPTTPISPQSSLPPSASDVDRRQPDVTKLDLDVLLHNPVMHEEVHAPHPSQNFVHQTPVRKADSITVDTASNALKEMARFRGATDYGPSCGPRISSRSSALGDWSAASNTVPASASWGLPGEELEGGLWSRGGIWGPQGLTQRPGPALTPSATFPRRGRAGGWNGYGEWDSTSVGSMTSSSWPSPVIDPVSRAPGAGMWIDRRASDVGLWTRQPYIDEDAPGSEGPVNYFVGSGRAVDCADHPSSPYYDFWDSRLSSLSEHQGDGRPTGSPSTRKLVAEDATHSLFSDSAFVDHGIPMSAVEDAYSSSGYSVFSQDSQTIGMSALPPAIRTRTTDSRFSYGGSLPSSPSGFPSVSSPFDSPRAGMSPRQHSFFSETVNKATATRLGVIGPAPLGSGMLEGAPAAVRPYTPCMEVPPSPYSPRGRSLDHTMLGYATSDGMDNSCSLWSEGFGARS